VANAFAIMGIVMAIFSVLAFVLFADRDPINFGSFSKAYFTMFQVRRVTCRSLPGADWHAGHSNQHVTQHVSIRTSAAEFILSKGQNIF
jgi:hypothetical protein